MLFAVALAVSAFTVIDGDTIKGADGQRIRLLAIDAPEMGKCPKGRVCAPGDPVASTASLRGLLRGPIEVQAVGKDRYGRTLAVVRVNGVNLSCAQLASGNAIYRRDWDDGGRVRAECPGVAR
jgi:endonuclease YncB( thermonuclease family)